MWGTWRCDVSEPAVAGERKHSEDWFGEWRDHWWHPDFLALMAQRWGLGTRSRVLDVGSGVGHWGRALSPYLPEHASVVGVEREPAWVAEATRRAAAGGLTGRFTYVQGVAEALPFPDASFDVVTCQTVLMHLADAAVGVREMRRVLAPGGILIAVEPNNRAGAILEPNIEKGRPIEEVLAHVRLHVLCERGKAALGEGYNALGEELPSLLADAGFEGVEVYLADKAYSFLPPYRTPDEVARIAEQADLVARDLFIADRATCERYYTAAGGGAEAFTCDWHHYMNMQRRCLAALEAGTFASAGGALCYLVSGRKPG